MRFYYITVHKNRYISIDKTTNSFVLHGKPINIKPFTFSIINTMKNLMYIILYKFAATKILLFNNFVKILRDL